MKKLSVVIPVYFNEENLTDLFDKLDFVEKELLLRAVSLELVFVDDGSGDKSLTILKSIQPSQKQMKIIKLSRNFGAMSAARTGLQYVNGDCFVILAADLQDPPKLILDMVDLWLSGAKYVICERLERDDPISSKAFSAFYYRVLRTFVIKNYPKNGFDLALMDSRFLPHILNCGKHVNISLLSFWLGVKPEVISYNRLARVHGKSRWTFKKKLKLFFDSIFSFSNTPIRVISVTGAAVSVLSFAYGAVIVGSALLGKSEVPGFASIASILSFLLGLIIVMLGILSEYVWRIFDEVNKHPYSVVEEVI